MKIAVIGSRTFDNYSQLQEELHIIIYEENEGLFDDVVIVSGGARGADSLGAMYANQYNLELVIYEANWKDLSHPNRRIKEGKYGKYDANAGHRRNTLIIDDADIIVAFHNGSPGTADSLKKARKLKKKVFEFNY